VAAVRIIVALSLAVLLAGLLPALPQRGGEAPGQPITGAQARADVTGTALVRLPMRASHVALSWADPDAGDHEGEDEDEPHASGLSIAFSRDGRSFGEEREVLLDTHAGATDVAGLVRSGVIWTGGARFVRLTSAEPITGLTIDAIQAEAAVGGASYGPIAAAAVDQPQVISRSGWSADESLRFWREKETPDPALVGTEKWPAEFYPIQKLIVHHTAGANNDPNPAATIRAIYYDQAISRGWGDIGYNFLIDEQGRIYEGRYSREYAAGELPSGDDGAGKGVVGAHVGGWNSGTVGIALLGHLVSQDATPAARQSLEWLLAWLAERYGIDPLGGGTYTNPIDLKTRDNPNISGHRDWAATACPGGTFYATLPALRQAVANRIADGGTPPPPPPPPQVTVPGAPALTAMTAPKRPGVRLSWTVPASSGGAAITSYRILRWNGSRFVRIATVKASVRSFRDQRTVRGRTYRYVVRAVNRIGVSPYSNEASAAAR